MPNATISDSLAEKWKFIEKYDKVSKFIKPNTACYAIASEWWLNFDCLATLASTESDMLMGNPGPINNLPLLNLNKMYKDLVHSKEEGGRSDSIPHQVLTDMNDWDNMSLKPELRYRDDFVIVSHSMWKFLLEQFGGGPEIEFVPESKPTNPAKFPKNAITYQDEPYLNDDIVINLDMIKVYITKGHNFECAMPRYISPSITVHNLLSRLSNPNFLHASLYLKSKQNDLVELESNLEGLAEKGVQNGSFLMYTEDTGSTAKGKEEEIASSKDYPYGGKEVDYNDYDALDYANTYSDYPNQGDVEMKDFKNEGKNGHQQNESADKNNARLEIYRQLSKQAAEKEKIKLGFKTLDEIKNNLVNIQEEWNLGTGTNSK